VGKTVHGRLDFEERFSRMQQHTGEHIISGIVHGMFGYDNVGFHLGAEITTLDFNGELTEAQVQDVERRANRAVFADLPVEVLYPTKEELQNMDYRSKIEIEGQVRIVRIPGVDVCACCAPHTDRTGEVGLIKILSCDRHRGGCRMVMVSGMRALGDYRQKQSAVTEVSVALSAPQEKIAEAVHRLQKQLENVKEQRNRLQEAHLQQKLNELAADAKNICIFEEELDPIAARNFVNAAMERCDGICGAFIGTDEGGYRYILGSRTMDMRAFAKELNTRFPGKGGGKPEMVQGSLVGDHKEIEKMINSK
jgi:alanyl-tRNA synthetase